MALYAFGLGRRSGRNKPGGSRMHVTTQDERVRGASQYPLTARAINFRWARCASPRDSASGAGHAPEQANVGRPRCDSVRVRPFICPSIVPWRTLPAADRRPRFALPFWKRHARSLV